MPAEGTPAIFVTRFLPGIRSVVPVFAGVTHQGWLPVALPIALASGIWYGGLVWLGAWAGSNVDRLTGVLDRINLGARGGRCRPGDRARRLVVAYATPTP